MVLWQLNIHMQKNEPAPLPYHIEHLTQMDQRTNLSNP